MEVTLVTANDEWSLGTTDSLSLEEVPDILFGLIWDAICNPNDSQASEEIHFTIRIA